jgi:valyl-tRNA synthetase
MLEKTYQPAEIETRIHQEWERAGAFRCGRPERAKAEPYCIVIPPPNVTGSLHMGHALNNTLQDVLCRFERMRGKDVLWQPGTDHAGIATQMVVERQLAERQEPSRKAMGRERFLERVWAWKAESGGTIVNQLKRLGASCDWSRERFTMDEGLSRAVLKVFVDLYRAGLVYKDKRLVNWDPEFQSAVSDLEVDSIEVKGHLWHIRYPLKDDPTRFIVVATTRPETMLGDTAVAVHPDDERYKALVGKTCVLPLVGRELPIIADAYSDPNKGSGAVKITPAHDFNDFEVRNRHKEKIRLINIFDEAARTLPDGFEELDFIEADRMRGGPPSLDMYPEDLRGIDRFEARKRVVAKLEALGLLEKIEPHTYVVPHAQRGGAIIEPRLSEQWYVDAATLAKPAVEAVRTGKTRFVPERFANDYYRWLENITPWCISRQLWWGHRIPAWYAAKGEPFVAMSAEEATQLARQHYRALAQSAPEGSAERAKGRAYSDVVLTDNDRDPDVLDTWFSSALWPFSTLGWPIKTRELARYYPTSALVTGFDIIFFWVARMMMTGVHFMKEVPFRDVYIHGLVRDNRGQKMSKSKGNVMDPLDLIDGIDLDSLVVKRTAGLKPADAKRVAQETKRDYPEGIKPYGADALRFSLAAMASQGADVKFSVQRIEGYRNFATKLWNAARFAGMNECLRQREFDPTRVGETVNRWIVGETEQAARTVTTAIEAYKFNEAAGAIYEFTWGLFCDWYLELIKPVLTGDDEPAKAETRACVGWVLDQILKLLHPFMPFVTEELWAHVVEHGVQRRSLLALSEWPRLEGLADAEAAAEIGWVIRLVSEVRSVRSEMNVPAGAKVPLVLTNADKATRVRAERHEDTLKRLARLDGITFAKSAPKGAAVIVAGGTTAALPLAGVIDMGAEHRRLEKEIEKAASDLAKMDAKLGNPQFMAKAKEEAIEEARVRKDELDAFIRRLKAALKRIEA